MLILFEGIDKSGKSTLIKKFQELSGIRSFKNPVKPTKKMYDRGIVNGLYFGAYEAVKASGTDMIFDRSHVTEMAYAKIKRGYRPDYKRWAEWEEENKHLTVVVYVDTPEEILKERFKKDKEEYLTEKDIKGIGDAYGKYLLKNCKVSVICIDGSLSKQRMLTQLVIQLQNLGFWTSTRNR